MPGLRGGWWWRHRRGCGRVAVDQGLLLCWDAQHAAERSCSTRGVRTRDGEAAVGWGRLGMKGHGLCDMPCNMPGHYGIVVKHHNCHKSWVPC